MSTWNTPKVTTMASMFENAGKYTKFNLENRTVSKDTDITGLFYGTSLTCERADKLRKAWNLTENPTKITYKDCDNYAK